MTVAVTTPSYDVILPIRIGYLTSIVFPKNLTLHKKVCLQGVEKKITLILDHRSKISHDRLQSICLSLEKVWQKMGSDKVFKQQVNDGLFAGFIRKDTSLNPPDPISQELSGLVHHFIASFAENEHAWPR